MRDSLSEKMKLKKCCTLVYYQPEDLLVSYCCWGIYKNLNVTKYQLVEHHFLLHHFLLHHFSLGHFSLGQLLDNCKVGEG